MDSFILGLQTIGAWLLFGAPLLQAATELYEEVKGWEAIKNKHESSKRKDIGKIQFWWWLLPPLKIYLEKRRIQKIQKTYSDIKLSDETRESLHKYALKVNGWSGVTIGGWLAAIGTTWQLVGNFELGPEIWLGLVIFFSYVSILIKIKLLIKK